MKTLATPLGLAGLGSNPEAERRHDQFFNWRVAGTALLVALAYYLGTKIDHLPGRGAQWPAPDAFAYGISQFHRQSGRGLWAFLAGDQSN